MLTDKANSTAYAMGMRAYQTNGSRNNVPFRGGTQAHADWHQGWIDAQALTNRQSDPENWHCIEPKL